MAVARWAIAASLGAVCAASAATTRADARIARDRVEVRPAIGFVVDRPALRPESEAVLVEVAALLASHPEVERLRVEQHVDGRGSAHRVRLLGEQRARAITDFLSARGVDPLRLESVVVNPCDGALVCTVRPTRRTVLRIVTPTARERAFVGRRREQGALFEALGQAALRCGGARTRHVVGQLGVALSAECFFASGATQLRREASPLLAIVAREAATHRARRYTVDVEAADGSPQPWQTSSARAAAVAAALVRAGIDAPRLSASARAESIEEVYDGPAHLAPGNALVVFSLDPDVAETR
ncbi:MAG: OmpA family protein [Deltaproteobacteria bacterium]|nr:OmpA family protein [Deltaproteobacteria bacterium]